MRSVGCRSGGRTGDLGIIAYLRCKHIIFLKGRRLKNAEISEEKECIE